MLWTSPSLKKASLICDIGSASVGIALVDFSTPKPTILISSRAPISIQEVFDLSSLEPLLVSFFDEALRMTEKSQKSMGIEGEGRQIEAIHFFFSSPWYVAKSISQEIIKEKPFFLDQHSLENLILSEEKRFQEALVSSPQGSFLGDMAVIERELLTIRLNGYETSNPFLKQATNIDLSLFMSVVPHRLLHSLDSRVSKTFHVKNIFAHAFPLAGFRAIKLAAPQEKEYLFLDIAGEMTDTVMVKSGVISYVGSFSFGRNALIRAVAKSFSLPLEASVSLLSLHSKDMLDADTKTKIETLVREALITWRSEIEMIIKKNTGEMQFPQRVFVTVDDDVSFVFLSALRNATGDERGVFQITNTMTENSITYSKHVVPDPFLSLETLSVEYFLSNKNLQ